MTRNAFTELYRESVIHTAKRDGWRPSELACTLVDVEQDAHRLWRRHRATYVAMPVDELRAQLFASDQVAYATTAACNRAEALSPTDGISSDSPNTIGGPK